jgi:hypothetical protein
MGAAPVTGGLRSPHAPVGSGRAPGRPAGCRLRRLRKPEVTAKDRMECDAYARSVARPGSDHYKGIYARCIYGIQHPERGGG